MCSSRVLHGYYLADDWASFAEAHFAGFSDMLNRQIELDIRRPVGALYLTLIFTLLGGHLKLLLALSAALHFLTAACLYAILRELRFRWVDATAIAVLVLLFPYADSTWLWATESLASFAIVCVLLGSLLNLRAAAAHTQHRALLHVAGLASIAAGMLTYELVLPLALASGALYFTKKPPRQALRVWLTDLVVFGIVIVVFTLHLIPVLHGSDVHEVVGFAEMRKHIHLIASQFPTLLAYSLIPFGTPAGASGVVLVLSVAALALVVALLLNFKSHARGLLLRWLAVLACGIAVVALGYIALIPSSTYYVPLQPGASNRINAVAAIGYAIAAYAVAMLIATLAFRDLPRSRELIGGLAVLVVAVIGVGYSHRVDADKAAWHQSGVAQQAILTTLRAHLPTPQRGASVITIDAPVESAPGVPIFEHTWDLAGAVQLIWSDPTLTGYPLAVGATVGCAATQLLLHAVNAPEGWRAAYPAYIVDVANGATYAVTSQSSCVQAATNLQVLANA